MPTLTGTIEGVTGVPVALAKIRAVYVRAPLERGSLASAGGLISSVPVPVDYSETGQIAIDLEPGPAILVVEHDARDVYELNVTADMTLLTEALAEPASDRSWAVSQMVQLRSQTVTAAGDAQAAKSDAEGAASVAEGHRTHVDAIRDLLDEAAQTNVAPYLTDAALKATYANLDESGKVAEYRLPRPPAAATQGSVVFTWDDAYTQQYTVVAALADQLGQKHTFFVPSRKVDLNSSFFTSAHVRDLHARGHEIGSHTVNENGTGLLKDLPPAEREYEYDQSRAALEGILGPDTVTTFAYAQSTHSYSYETARELLGRYGRAMVSASPSIGLSVPGETGFLIRRLPWNSASHQEILSQIRLVRESGMTLCLSAHLTGDITEAELAEAMNLVTDLGVATLTCREAFPSVEGVVNHSFENGMSGWKSIQGSAGGSTANVVSGPVHPGLAGSRYLKLTTDAASINNWIFAAQNVVVSAGRTYTLSFMSREFKTAGTAPRGTVRFYPETFSPGLTPVPPATVVDLAPPAADPQAWQRQVIDYTPPAGTSFLRLDLRIPGNFHGELHFDHLHFGPKEHGNFG